MGTDHLDERVAAGQPAGGGCDPPPAAGHPRRDVDRRQLPQPADGKQSGRYLLHLWALPRFHQRAVRPGQLSLSGTGGGAWLYEGPNLYWLLNARQRKRTLNLRCRIFNYIDPRDVVALGYLDAQHTIGLLQIVQSILVSPIGQHMWGGYQFDQTGRLLLADDAELQYRSLLDRYLFERAQRQSYGHISNTFTE